MTTANPTRVSFATTFPLMRSYMQFIPMSTGPKTTTKEGSSIMCKALVVTTNAITPTVPALTTHNHADQSTSFPSFSVGGQRNGTRTVGASPGGAQSKALMASAQKVTNTGFSVSRLRCRVMEAPTDRANSPVHKKPMTTLASGGASSLLWSMSQITAIFRMRTTINHDVGFSVSTNVEKRAAK